ncbi:MAG: hypothetical protein L0J44_09335 [Tetragenococcus koreensis]|nr:hypothetical protein [Tetragenococcus koreensis]
MYKKEMLEIISEFLNENVVYGKCQVNDLDLDVEKGYRPGSCQTLLTIRINTQEVR